MDPLLPTDCDDAATCVDDGEELFEAAVLFTDVRGSCDLISRTAPRTFFRQLNRSLSAQAACIREFGGEVVKYTGDGLLAVFRGADGARPALHCALQLARTAGLGLPYGIGVAAGPVLAGLVGPDAPGQRRQPDVIGAPVHLAARLCSMAAAGEVLTTQAARTAAQLHAAVLRPLGAVVVPGFREAIDCVAFDLRAQAQSWSPSR